MRDEIPAALPLIGFVTGLALGHHVLEAGAVAIVALLLTALRRRDLAIAALAIAAGLFVAAGESRARFEEEQALRKWGSERFAVVEVPLQSGWSERHAGASVRVRHFRVNGRRFDRPLTVFARFEPPPPGMHTTLIADGFLRPTSRGEYAMSVKSPRLLRYSGRRPWWHPGTWNHALTARLRTASAYPLETALVEALVLGRDERLDEATRENFRAGGTYHLLVFSGLQIGLAAATIALLLRLLAIRTQRVADVMLLIFAAIAPLFIGAAASVTRASIGVALYALSRLSGRPTSFENLWCLSALLRLALVPSDLTDPGFQLTFAGAGALIFIGKPLARSWLRWAAYPLAAQIAVIPLTLFHFHQYALAGAITTMAMTPIVLAMLVIGAAACALPHVDVILMIVGVLNAACRSINDLAAPASGFFAAPPAGAMIGAASLALVALLMRRPAWRAVVISLALLIPTVSAGVRILRYRNVEHPAMIALDVGQGDALVLRSGHKSMLIDGGGVTEASRFAETTLLPLLLDNGITSIDVVVLTHAHPDHCTGLAGAVEHLNVGALWISPRRFSGDCATRLLDAARRRQTPIHLARDGDSLVLGEFRVKVITADRTFKRAKENNSSIVLRATTRGRRFLLTGDIEREAEYVLGDRDLRADVLKVAHHGSRSSTTADFLDAVSPRLALISCGRNNLFGHPHPSVVGRLSERGVRMFRTDRDGTVSVSVRGRGSLFVTGRRGER